MSSIAKGLCTLAPAELFASQATGQIATRCPDQNGRNHRCIISHSRINMKYSDIAETVGLRFPDKLKTNSA